MVRQRKTRTVAVIPPSDNAITALPTDDKSNIDRVGNIEQKEEAARLAGLTRLELVTKIKEMLVATKVVFDSFGKGYDEPDNAIRAKGVELGLKYFGDLKEFQPAGGSVTHNKVVYQWLTVNNNSPEVLNVRRD